MSAAEVVRVALVLVGVLNGHRGAPVLGEADRVQKVQRQVAPEAVERHRQAACDLRKIDSLPEIEGFASFHLDQDPGYRFTIAARRPTIKPGSCSVLGLLRAAAEGSRFEREMEHIAKAPGALEKRRSLQQRLFFERYHVERIAEKVDQQIVGHG